MKIKHRVVYFKAYDSFDDDVFVAKAVMPSTLSVEVISQRGFWLDDTFEITDQSSDVKYWVAPASIIGVSILEEDTNSV